MLGDKRPGGAAPHGCAKRHCTQNDTKAVLAGALHDALRVLFRDDLDQHDRFWVTSTSGARAQFALPTTQELMGLSKNELIEDLRGMGEMQ